MLDHMSGGRLEIGFGRGSVPFEISYYGQNAEERQQIYAERLELILKAFTVKTLTWKGRYDQFENVPMEMEPFQKPHPPLWYGAHSPDSAERAARKGLNMVTNDMPANDARHRRALSAGLARGAGRDDAAQDGHGAIHRRGRQRREGDDDRAPRLSALASELHLSVRDERHLAELAVAGGELRQADRPGSGDRRLARDGA